MFSQRKTVESMNEKTCVTWRSCVNEAKHALTKWIKRWRGTCDHALTKYVRSCVNEVRLRATLRPRPTSQIRLSVGGRKKIGVDWPRPSRFRKNFQRVNVKIEKIGVDRSREMLKRPLQRQVSLMFFRTGHLGVADAFCTSMACPWQEV
jgi:hypothetical protein